MKINSFNTEELSRIKVCYETLPVMKISTAKIVNLLNLSAKISRITVFSRRHFRWVFTSTREFVFSKILLKEDDLFVADACSWSVAFRFFRVSLHALSSSSCTTRVDLLLVYSIYVHAAWACCMQHCKLQLRSIPHMHRQSSKIPTRRSTACKLRAPPCVAKLCVASTFIVFISHHYTVHLMTYRKARCSDHWFSFCVSNPARIEEGKGVRDVKREDRSQLFSSKTRSYLDLVDWQSLSVHEWVICSRRGSTLNQDRREGLDLASKRADRWSTTCFTHFVLTSPTFQAVVAAF